MNTIGITDYKDFQELFNESILITGKLSKQQEEIRHNTWGIMLDSEFAQKVTLQDLQLFFKELMHHKSIQLQQNKYKGPVTVYFWVEELSGRLCFDILSGRNIKLPFSCKLNLLSSIDPILQSFLNINHRTATTGADIAMEDIKFLELGDEGFGDDYTVDWIQDVYVTTLSD